MIEFQEILRITYQKGSKMSSRPHDSHATCAGAPTASVFCPFTAGSPSYALGHSQQELKRLTTQADFFEPFTRRMFERAGLAQGMRVLDVGSGNGDVALLAASLVGESGEVLGIDRAPCRGRSGERTRASCWPQERDFRAR